MGERRGTKALEIWCRKCIEGYDNVRVDNMTTSWRNGLAFCALIHNFRPDLIDYAKLKKEDIYNNNELAFHVAEKYLSIPALLDPADMLKYEVPDRLSILTYLSQYYQVFSSQEPASNNTIKKTNQENKPSGGSPPPKMAAVIGMPKREPCKKCSLPVFLAERMKIGNNFYHRTCLRCARCDTQLTMGSFYETEVDNEFCCETCPDEEKPTVANAADTIAEPILIGDSLNVLKRPLSDEEKSSSLKRQIAGDDIQFVANKKLNNFLTSQIDSSSSSDEEEEEQEDVEIRDKVEVLDSKTSINRVYAGEIEDSTTIGQFSNAQSITTTSTPVKIDKNISSNNHKIHNNEFINDDEESNMKLNKSSELRTLSIIAERNNVDKMYNINANGNDDDKEYDKTIKSLENVTKDDNNISKSEFKLRLNKFESLSTNNHHSSSTTTIAATSTTAAAATSSPFNKYRHSISSVPSLPAAVRHDGVADKNRISLAPSIKLKSTSDNHLTKYDQVPIDVEIENDKTMTKSDTINDVNNEKLDLIDSVKHKNDNVNINSSSNIENILNKSSNDLVSVPNNVAIIANNKVVTDDLQMHDILDEINVQDDAEKMEDLFEAIYNDNANADTETIPVAAKRESVAPDSHDIDATSSIAAETIVERESAIETVTEEIVSEKETVAEAEEPMLETVPEQDVKSEEIVTKVVEDDKPLQEDSAEVLESVILVTLAPPTQQTTVQTEEEQEKLENDTKIIYPTDLNPFGDDEESDSGDTGAASTSSNLDKSNSNYNKSLNPFGDDDEEDEEVEVRKTAKSSNRISNNPFGSESDSEKENDSTTRASTAHLKRTPVPTPRVNLSVNLTPEPSPRLIRNAAHKINTLYASESSRLSVSTFGGSTSSLNYRKKNKAPAPPVVPEAIADDTPSVSSAENSSFNSRRTSPYMKKKRPAPQPPCSTPKMTITSERGNVSSINDSTKSINVTDDPNISDSLKMSMHELSDSALNLQSESKLRLIPLEASLMDTSGNVQESLVEPEKDEIVTYRRKLVPLSPDTTFTDDSLHLEESERDREWEKVKDNKEAQNRNRQSLDMSGNDEYSDKYTNKSSHGKWKRRKGPAPVAVPPRRVLKMLPLQEIRDELELIEVQQQGLEKQGVTLEKMIRERCESSADAESASGESTSTTATASDKNETPTKNTKEVEDLIMQLFDLVNEKNELFRRQAELMYLRRQHRLEQEQADLEYEIRVLMAQPERNKTDSDKSREESLITRLVEVVQMRNEVIECLEMDRIREKQEDLSIQQHIEIHTANQDDELSKAPIKLSKKEKKKMKEAKKLAKLKKTDADKDTDETEVTASVPKEKKKKKKFLF